MRTEEINLYARFEQVGARKSFKVLCHNRFSTTEIFDRIFSGIYYSTNPTKSTSLLDNDFAVNSPVA